MSTIPATEGVPVGVTQATQRDARIDALRGVFILSMAADHLGHLLQLIGLPTSAKLYTYQSLGWSSAAEFFVFFSGYVLAGVYGRTQATLGFGPTQWRGVHRAWELYVRNALVFVLVLALVGWLFADSAALLQATRLDLGMARGLLAVRDFMRLDYFPTFLEVLPLYMLLVLAAPGFVALQARWPALPISLSAALWLAVQLAPGLNLHTPGAWHFNPFAWQFVFFLGMWLARVCPLQGLQERLRPQRRRQLPLVLALLLACLVLKALDKADVVLPLVGALDLPGLGKTQLGPLRLLHFGLVLWLIALAMPSNAWVRAHALPRAVARVGTHSLDCFCASIVLCYALAGVFAQSERGSAVYFGLQAINLGGLVLLACWLQWFKGPPWRSPPGGPVRPPRRTDASGYSSDSAAPVAGLSTAL
jgi:hypothetical protein